MTAILLSSFLIVTAVAFAVATLQRSYRATSPRDLLKVLEEQPRDGKHDASEKLTRISVLFDFLMLFVRPAWFALWFGYRSDARPWYWQSPDWSLFAWWGLLAATLETVFMSFLFLVLLPQLVAVFHGSPLAVGLLPITYRMETLCSPFTASYRWLVRTLRKVSGQGEEQTSADLAEEGIRAAVEIGELQGVLHDREKTMIESMLEFHDVEVSEVMTPRTEMVCLESVLTASEAIPLVIECGHSRIPVFRDNLDNIIGVLYVKDLVRYDSSEHGRSTPIERIVRKVYFVPESKKISELLGEFRANRFHIAVILDEYGGTSGLVTIEDIIEEIIGEIEDEYDQGSNSLVHRIRDNLFEVDGRAHVSDLNELAGTTIPESDDYDTVAGFLFTVIGRVPKEGESVEAGGARFQVTSANERKIRRLTMQLLNPQVPAER